MSLDRDNVASSNNVAAIIRPVDSYHVTDTVAFHLILEMNPVYIFSHEIKKIIY